MLAAETFDDGRLAAALARRGIGFDAWSAMVLTVTCDADDLRTARRAHPAALIVAIAPRVAHAALLDGGADDVIAPDDDYDLRAARIAALVRRQAGVLRVGELAIETIARRTTRAGRVLPLLQREYAMLLHLAQRAGRTVSRAELRQAVLRRGFDPGTNVIEVHVSRLRAKLDRGFAWPMLLTEKGVGYRLVDGP